jgi:hypothetical protein
MRNKKSMWDILYDLYLHMEHNYLSHVSDANKDVCVDFPDWECNQLALYEIRSFLQPKADKDYVRFLEFYNGLTLGQWVFLGAFPDVKDASLDVMYVYDCEAKMRKNTPSDITDKMLPIAINNDTMCYLAKTGDVFSLPWTNDRTLYSQEPVLVSHSFEEFMNECVLGPRYPEFGKEDATYHYLQQRLEIEAELDRDFGNDKNENPARDPQIITGLRCTSRELAKQTAEQIKDLPEGTRINSFSIEKLGK